MDKQRIIKDLTNHLFKLSYGNKLLVKQRFSELIAHTGGNTLILSKLTKLQSKSWEEMLQIADKLYKLNK